MEGYGFESYGDQYSEIKCYTKTRKTCNAKTHKAALIVAAGLVLLATTGFFVYKTISKSSTCVVQTHALKKSLKQVVSSSTNDLQDLYVQLDHDKEQILEIDWKPEYTLMVNPTDCRNAKIDFIGFVQDLLTTKKISLSGTALLRNKMKTRLSAKSQFHIDKVASRSPRLLDISNNNAQAIKIYRTILRTYAKNIRSMKPEFESESKIASLLQTCQREVRNLHSRLRSIGITLHQDCNLENNVGHVKHLLDYTELRKKYSPIESAFAIFEQMEEIKRKMRIEMHERQKCLKLN